MVPYGWGGLVHAALLVLFSASAGAWIVASDFSGPAWSIHPQSAFQFPGSFDELLHPDGVHL
jgi:hypothetical protein